MSADEVQKYKLCSPTNGSGTTFLPYNRLTGNSGDVGFVAMNTKGSEVDYSDVKFCSNPTF